MKRVITASKYDIETMQSQIKECIDGNEIDYFKLRQLALEYNNSSTFYRNRDKVLTECGLIDKFNSQF